VSALNVWTVYDHPSDYPYDYVARLFVVTHEGVRPTDSVLIESDIEEIRSRMISDGLCRLMRNEEDDPVIMETWL
jgi:hypothetical protein